jgi:hypothetical protein
MVMGYLDGADTHAASAVSRGPAEHRSERRGGSVLRRSRHRQRREQVIRTLIRRDGCQCVWCGRPLPERGPEVTVDHLVPKSVSGGMRAVNLALCCRSCNRERGDTPVDEWARRIERLEFTPNLRVIERALDRTASMRLPYSDHAAAQLAAVRRIREGAVLDSLAAV